MGHGSDHFANAAYPALDYHFKNADMNNVFVGTVEGFPDLDSYVTRNENRYKKCNTTSVYACMR